MQAKVEWKGDHKLGFISLMPQYEINLMVTALDLRHMLVAEEKQDNGMKPSFSLTWPDLQTFVTSPGFSWQTEASDSV